MAHISPLAPLALRVTQRYFKASLVLAQLFQLNSRLGLHSQIPPPVPPGITSFCREKGWQSLLEGGKHGCRKGGVLLIPRASRSTLRRLHPRLPCAQRKCQGCSCACLASPPFRLAGPCLTRLGLCASI